MEATRHSKYVQHALDEQKITDISKIPASRQIAVYHLALEKSKEILISTIYHPREIPLATLKDSRDVLNELSINLVLLGMKPSIDQDYKLNDEVLPRINKALALLGPAIAYRERELLNKKAHSKNRPALLPEKYDQNVIQFRMLVLQSCELLRPPS